MRISDWSSDVCSSDLFLAHGEIDERTPYKQAVEMKKALEAAGRMPEWMSVPGEAHGFYKDENNAAFYKRLEAFLARNIGAGERSEEHTSELQSLMRISYAVFCLKKKKRQRQKNNISMKNYHNTQRTKKHG